MRARITFATARRVLNQLRRDPRTVVLLVVVPAALLSLLRWLLDHQRGSFDHIGAPVLAIFPFVVMFIAGTNLALLGALSLGGVGAILFVATHISERMARLTAFMHP